jgi:amidase
MGQDGSGTGMGRREFLGRMALAGGALLPIAATNASAVGDRNRAAPEARSATRGPHLDLEEATIADLQAAMAAGRLTSLELVRRYQERIEAIDRNGPCLNSVIENNPEAEAIAASLDAERRTKGVRGPLHGIPVLIKDNIDTADRMRTTAGSLALLGSRPARDATVAQRLRAAGAVILGKTNLSEWANMRSGRSSSGWSGRGGQTRNPYVLTHNPCGSSSGSAVAVSANLCVAALGTETDGSIVCPSHINGVVGIKPTVGLTSRAGVVPISHNQDTVGPHARTVRDAAILLGALAGVDPRDAATAASDGRSMADYTRGLDPNGLRGARIGVARKTFFGYSAHADRVIEEAIAVLRTQGAILVDPADLPSAEEMSTSPAELEVLLYDLKADMAAYLATRVPDAAHPELPMVRTLAQLIAFNESHRMEEMTFFGQDLFEEAQAKGSLTDAAYTEALAACRRMGGREGIDAVMDRYQLDALIAPTGGPAWPTDHVNGDHFLGASSAPAAIAGYPIINVPAGSVFGLPIGISFMGRAWSEPALIKLAYAYEQASRARKAPEYREGLAGA